MTRARWLTGALIGAASLIVAGQSLLTYLAERLVVGAVAVVVLMGVTAIGFASLARARRSIARELAALGGEAPAGALYQARRAQLVALRERGVSPDLDLLADATAAAEAERGYTGRYLVATTVLIGLVGTFGGLMETLARATPLLKGDLPSTAAGPTAALALIAGPLAGLHVTFGTSVVAILVTLALTLIQGDVTLHQERLLALLQERTRHVLVPELWPAQDSAAERTVRALVDLRAFVAESLAASAASTAEKIARVVRVEVQALVAQIRAELQVTTAAQSAALERTGAGLTDGLRQTTESVARELASTAARTLQSVTASTEAAVTELGELRASLGAELRGASQALAGSAAELRGAVGALSPAVAELAPQLGGLTAEIALLAARADSPEQPNAVLDELVRLSEDVERLLASSEPVTATTEVAARETGS